MVPDAFAEKLQEIIADLTRTGHQRPLFFACIAADGCTMTGSYGTDRRLVMTPPTQEELPLSINILFVDTRAKAWHVATSHANDMEQAREAPQGLGLWIWISSCSTAASLTGQVAEREGCGVGWKSGRSSPD